ncbi:MAG: segregation/condensation protein A [bacterium]|nr:segregation/condensation protein A [bacterium]
MDLLNDKKLSITDIALAKITDDYLAYLEAHPAEVSARADFLLTASRLIYLKSRELLPYLRIEEEEEGIEDLKEQLEVYKQFQDASQTFLALYHSPNRAYAREKHMKLESSEEERRFAPAKNVTESSLRESFLSLLKKLEPFFSLQKRSMERIESVEERMKRLQKTLQKRRTIGFRDIARGASSKADVVVSFLALLELVKKQIVRVRQQQEDIEIIRV